MIFTSVKTSDYLAQMNECVQVKLVATNTVTIFAPSGANLPNGAEFEVVIVGDESVDGVVSVKPAGSSFMTVEGPRSPDSPFRSQTIWNVGDSLRFRFEASTKIWRVVGDGRQALFNTVPRIVHEVCVPRPNEYLICRSTLGAFNVVPYAFDANGNGSYAIGDSFAIKLENYSGSNAVTVKFGDPISDMVTVHTYGADVMNTVTLNADGECIVATYRGDDHWDLIVDKR